MNVPWRSVHPQTDHATIRPTRSVHAMNRLMWQFTTVTFFHLYDPSRYFSSTPASRWMVCHMWYNVHPPRNALWHLCPAFPEAKSGWFVTKFLDPFVMSPPPPAGCLATCGCFATGFFKHVCNDQLAFQRNVDFLSHDFWTFVMSCLLLSKMWTFCYRIFSTRLQCPTGFSAKCERFFAWFLATFVTSKRLLNEMWMFCHRIYAKIMMALSEEEK